MHYAVLREDTDLVRLLLQHEANIDVTSDGGATALYIAVFQENTELVRLLLQMSQHYIIIADPIEFSNMFQV